MTGAKTRSKSDKSANYHHGDLRNALARAATDILEEAGLEKLSLRGVARRAGVSAAAPYHHFKDKDALLAALATDGFRDLLDTMRAHATDYTDPADIRAGLGAGYVVFAQQRPALFRLMFADSRYLFAEDENLVAAASSSYALLEQSVADLVSETGQGGDDALKVRLAASSWAQAHGLATLVGDGALHWKRLGYDTASDMAFAILRDVTFKSLQDTA